MTRITFHGAAGTVTGSAYLIDTGRVRLLLDFGLFQGVHDQHDLNVLPPTLDVRALDAVLVTHAHLDHTGRLPLLAKHGYKGPVFCTRPTVELSGLILRDSARLQAQDIERTNRKRQRADEPPLEPLYATHDVENVLRLMRTVEYDAPVPVAPGVHARFVEAGHLLGSASIQLRVETDGQTQCLAFSGDLGPRGAPILKDAEGFAKADAVVLESTYGDRDHKPFAETVAEFERLVQEAVERKGKLLVPTFAVGRAQLLLYLLALMFRRRVVPPFPIYVDSPMAIEAGRIYFDHLELFDDDFHELQRERPLADDLATVQPTPTAADSKALNDVRGPCLILAGSGMCSGGRILHHFKQNLWRPETTVLIVGYQGEGTLGRALVEGAKHVHVFGEKIAVKARVHTLGGFSAHAGQSGLLRWCEHLAPSRPEVILTHGEAKGRDPLAKLIQERFGLTARKPKLGEMVEV